MPHYPAIDYVNALLENHWRGQNEDPRDIFSFSLGTSATARSNNTTAPTPNYLYTECQQAHNSLWSTARSVPPSSSLSSSTTSFSEASAFAHRQTNGSYVAAGPNVEQKGFEGTQDMFLSHPLPGAVPTNLEDNLCFSNYGSPCSNLVPSNTFGKSSERGHQEFPYSFPQVREGNPDYDMAYGPAVFNSLSLSSPSSSSSISPPGLAQFPVSGNWIDYQPTQSSSSEDWSPNTSTSMGNLHYFPSPLLAHGGQFKDVTHGNDLIASPDPTMLPFQCDIGGLPLQDNLALGDATKGSNYSSMQPHWVGTCPPHWDPRTQQAFQGINHDERGCTFSPSEPFGRSSHPCDYNPLSNTSSQYSRFTPSSAASTGLPSPSSSQRIDGRWDNHSPTAISPSGWSSIASVEGSHVLGQQQSYQDTTDWQGSLLYSKDHPPYTSTLSGGMTLQENPSPIHNAQSSTLPHGEVEQPDKTAWRRSLGTGPLTSSHEEYAERDHAPAEQPGARPTREHMQPLNIVGPDIEIDIQIDGTDSDEDNEWDSDDDYDDSELDPDVEVSDMDTNDDDHEGYSFPGPRTFKFVDETPVSVPRLSPNVPSPFLNLPNPPAEEEGFEFTSTPSLQGSNTWEGPIPENWRRYSFVEHALSETRRQEEQKEREKKDKDKNEDKGETYTIDLSSVLSAPLLPTVWSGDLHLDYHEIWHKWFIVKVWPNHYSLFDCLYPSTMRDRDDDE